MVVPEDVLGRLGTELHDARQVHVAADVHVELGPAEDERLGGYATTPADASASVNMKQDATNKKT